MKKPSNFWNLPSKAWVTSVCPLFPVGTGGYLRGGCIYEPSSLLAEEGMIPTSSLSSWIPEAGSELSWFMSPGHCRPGMTTQASCLPGQGSLLPRQGLALWYTRLSCCVGCLHAIPKLQLQAHVPRKTADPMLLCPSHWCLRSFKLRDVTELRVVPEGMAPRVRG